MDILNSREVSPVFATPPHIHFSSSPFDGAAINFPQNVRSGRYSDRSLANRVLLPRAIQFPDVVVNPHIIEYEYPLSTLVVPLQFLTWTFLVREEVCERANAVRAHDE